MSEITLTEYKPPPRFDDEPWTDARIDGAPAITGPWTPIDTITFTDPDDDPTQPAYRNFTVDAPDTVAFVRVVFLDGDLDEAPTEPIGLTAPTTDLTTVRMVRARLGRPLTNDQAVQVQVLIRLATTNILAAADKDESWTVPTIARSFLEGLCIELVCRSMANPQSLGQESESLGAYSHTTTFAREIPGSGIGLTDSEELAVRRIVYGSNSGSARTRSLASAVIVNSALPSLLYPSSYFNE